MPTNTATTSNLTRGYKTAFACAMILSTTAIFIRYLTNTYHLPALVLAFWRDGFTALFLFLVLRIVRPHLLRMEREHMPYLIVYGLILAIFNALWTLSVSLNGAAISTVLVYSSAAFTTLLGWLLLKENLGWVKLLAVVFSLCGCALISGVTSLGALEINLIGIVTGILSGLSYAVYSLMGRSASERGLNPWTTLLYTFTFATVILLGFNLFSDGRFPGSASSAADLFWLGKSLAGWGILFLLAAGPTVLGFGLYNVSLVHLPSSVVNLIATLEPAFTAVTAYILLGERLSGQQSIGSLLIVSGVVFLRVYEGRVVK